MPKDLRGVLTAIITPFDADGAIDFDYVRRHLRFQREAGINGVVVSGTNGEGLSLSVAERKSLTEAVVSSADGLLIVASTGCASLPETIELSLFAQAAGADAILVVPPFFYRHVTLEGLLNYFRALLEAVRIPVLLYNIPSYSGIEISNDLLRGLAEYPHLIGVKDTSGDSAVTARFVEAFPDLKVFNGSDVWINETTRAGAAGAISGLGNAFPRLIVQTFEEAVGHGGRAQERVRELASIYSEYPGFAANKSALSYQGFPRSRVRPPLVDLTCEQENKFRCELESAGFL